MCPQIRSFSADTEFRTEIFPVSVNGSVGDIHDRGNVFRGFSLFDEVGDLDLFGCETEELGRHPSGKWGDDFLKIRYISAPF